MPSRAFIPCTVSAAMGLLLLCARAAAPAQGYQHSVVGNPGDVVTPTSGLLVLQGGGTDVDENFVRMGARAGGGDFVVIRASGTDAYNPYIYGLCSCDSVATIVFKNRNAAFNDFVIETIRNAEALWIAGGDQSRVRGASGRTRRLRTPYTMWRPSRLRSGARARAWPS